MQNRFSIVNRGVVLNPVPLPFLNSSFQLYARFYTTHTHISEIYMWTISVRARIQDIQSYLDTVCHSPLSRSLETAFVAAITLPPGPYDSSPRTGSLYRVACVGPWYAWVAVNQQAGSMCLLLVLFLERSADRLLPFHSDCSTGMWHNSTVCRICAQRSAVEDRLRVRI